MRYKKQLVAEFQIIEVQRQLVVKLAYFSSVLVLVFGIFNFIIGNTQAGYVFSFFFPLFVWSYYNLKHEINVFWVVNGLIVMNISILILNFFFNGGYQGPTNYGFFIMTFLLTLVFKGRLKFVWLAVLLLTHFIIMYLDIFDLKEVTNGYDDPVSLYIDHIFAFAGCAVFVFAVNDLFTRNYFQQGVLLEKASRKLDLQMAALEEINQGKDKLLGILAHDLRAPISSTGQILELIKNQALDKSEQELLFQSLEKQYKEMEQTLNSTLDFVLAEINSNQEKSAPVLSNPQAFTEKIIQSFATRLESKRQEVSLIVEGMDSNTTINFERNELEVILRNLLDNAIKFSPEGGVIQILLILNARSLCWKIKDQGPGLDKQTGDQLFKFKVQSSKGTRNERGIGLGMYLCKSLADKIGAQLFFETITGSGTTFILEKPLV
jgi:two-component system, sensor histidine kinase and response regulator